MADPRPGEVIFHAVCRPALTAGDYTLHVQTTLNKGSNRVDTGAKPLPSERVYGLSVDAPRFTMDPSMIHGVFPPTNGVGSYVTRLPMIVLRRRTLPWERNLSAGSDKPWLAVLLFEKGEATTLSPCTVGDVLQGAAGSTSPKLALSDVPDAVRSQPCLGLELPLGLFQEIAPMASEVPLLCHVRQVNTEDKELMGMDDDGWFAVVVGNRLPEPGKQYEACLVSLEGTEAFLPKPEHTPVFTAADLQRPRISELADVLSTFKGSLVSDNPTVSEGVLNEALLQHMQASDSAWTWQAQGGEAQSKTTQHGQRRSAKASAWSEIHTSGAGKLGVQLVMPKVRLFMLAQWSFECREGGDFEAIMQALPNNGGVAMLGLPPALAQAPGAVSPSDWRAALDTGHVPLQHLTREGEQTIAWYRGPLTPVGVQRESAGPYHSADQARRIDPATGLENLGYAAAFEIGRLLALGDARFALDLLNWRRSSRLVLDRRVIGQFMQAQIGLHAELPQLVDLRATLLPRLLTGYTTSRFDTLMQSGRLGVLRDATGLRELQSRLPGLSAENVAAAKGLDLWVAQSLMEGLLVGGSSVLESIGFAELPTLESDLELLAANPGTHFAPQIQAFEAQMRGFKQPG